MAVSAAASVEVSYSAGESTRIEDPDNEIRVDGLPVLDFDEILDLAE